MEHRARLNDYLDLGSTAPILGNKGDSDEFSKYGFTKYLDTSRPLPKPRNIYPNVPARSEVYSLTEDYLRKQEEYEKLPLDQKSEAPN